MYSLDRYLVTSSYVVFVRSVRPPYFYIVWFIKMRMQLLYVLHTLVGSHRNCGYLIKRCFLTWNGWYWIRISWGFQICNQIICSHLRSQLRAIFLKVVFWLRLLNMDQSFMRISYVWSDNLWTFMFKGFGKSDIMYIEPQMQLITVPSSVKELDD